MANLAVKYYAYLTQESKTGSGYAITSCRLNSANGNLLTSGKTYLILCWGYIDQSLGAARVEVRLSSNSSSPVPFAGCVHRHQGDYQRNFFFWTVWTADGEDVFLQYRASSTGTAYIDEQYIVAIELDDLASTDWYYNENTTTTALTTSWSSSNNASITFTPSQAGNWLVLFAGLHTTSGTAIQHLSRLVRSGEASDTTPDLSTFPSISDEILQLGLSRLLSLGAVSNTFAQQSALSSTGSTGDDRIRSAVFALRMDVFANWDGEYNAALAEFPSTNRFDTLAATASYTPNTASLDNIIIGTAAFNAVTSTSEVYGRLEEDDTTTLPGSEGTTDQRATRAKAAADVLQYAMLGVRQWSAASHKIDWDCGGPDETALVGVKYRNLVVFSPELAAGESLVKIISETERC